MVQQRPKRRFTSLKISAWKDRIAARLKDANQLRPYSHLFGKFSYFHVSTWSLGPVCIFLAMLVILASPLHWSSSFPVSDVNPSQQLQHGGWEQPDLMKTVGSTTEDPSEVHIVMIFDKARLNFTVASMRSTSFYASNPVVYHLLTPTGIHDEVRDLSLELVGMPSVYVYDIELCKEAISPIWFMAKRIHMSAMCKLFLADVLPNEVSRVLYIDSDTTVVNDISLCYFDSVKFNEQQFLGMGADMGESCQHVPDLCYPIGFESTIPEGLECATVPFRSKLVRKNGFKCQSAGDVEPYQYNGGTMLMDLTKMRAESFTTMFVLASLQTWRHLGHLQAQWGEQDMINNFFRFYPEVLHPLDCGCNYQFSAARRESKCGNHTVVVAHGWSRQMNDRSSRDKFNIHFNFFRFANIITRNDTPPAVFKVSLTSPDWNGTAPKPRHSISCSQQSHQCGIDDIISIETLKRKVARPNVSARAALNMPKVYILTRTSGRPVFFKEMEASVREQTYPNTVHLVLTDDSESVEYIKDVQDSMLVDSLVHKFHPEEVCDRCKHLSVGPSCASAPGLDKPEKRQAFFDCYCNTSYPMNDYVNTLQRKVQEGWILYLDDDNLLQDSFAVSELMAHVQSTDELVAFRSTLGRITPHNINFGKRVVMGDFDSSNFMFHSKHIGKAVWPLSRCGDFKVGSTLGSSMPIRWVNESFIQSNPLRAALGGLGKRQDSQHSGVTVIVTSYMTKGWRPRWVKEIIETYLSREMESLVAKVILVWNNVDEEIPSVIPTSDEYEGRLVVIRPTENSLNNRWVETLQYIDENVSKSVLNLDDDLYTTRQGLICMLNWHNKEPKRIIAPFVRRVAENHKYVMDELQDGSRYSIVLPRIMLAPVKYLKAYASANYTDLRRYIDNQSAHCDDILMNVVALKESAIPPLRVLLPESSVIDFYSTCWATDKEQTGGLGLQSGRTERRSECVRDIMNQAGVNNFKASLDVATCLPRGNALVKKREGISRQEFARMAAQDTPCLRGGDRGA